MAIEKRRQQPQEQAAIYRQLYSQAWEAAFSEFMFLMSEQYNLELLVEVPETGHRVPSPLVKMWRDGLGDLTPTQIHDGLLRYMESSSGRFKPSIGDIKEYGSQTNPVDRPKMKFNDSCEACNGTGWMPVAGYKDRTVTRCDCAVVMYNNTVYPVTKRLTAPMPKQLHQKTEDRGKEVVNAISKLEAAKFDKMEDNGLDLDKNRDILEKQKKQLLDKRG